MADGDQERAVMRCMAWERAKGELRSMLHTYIGQSQKHEVLRGAIAAFIDHVEDNGLHE